MHKVDQTTNYSQNRSLYQSSIPWGEEYGGKEQREKINNPTDQKCVVILKQTTCSWINRSIV